MGHNFSEAVRWFRDCENDNTREFWSANRDRYLREVRSPLIELLDTVGEGAEAWRIYKPHRDTRFSADSAPLKTFIGALRVDENGTGRYVQLDSRGILASSGLPYLAPDQLAAWRGAVDARPGLDEAIAVAQGAGCTIKSGYPEPLKRVPKGFDPEHPRAELLRWKGIEAYRREGDVGDLSGDWLVDTWRGGEPLCAWIGGEVGPSAMERPRR